jgi:hypothetical protein
VLTVVYKQYRILLLLFLCLFYDLFLLSTAQSKELNGKEIGGIFDKISLYLMMHRMIQRGMYWTIASQPSKFHIFVVTLKEQ